MRSETEHKMTDKEAVNTPGSTNTRDSETTVTLQNIDALFRRISDLEKGQTDIVATIDGFQENIGRLITAAISRALQTPAPSPQRQTNNFQEREYDLYRNPEKRPIDD